MQSIDRGATAARLAGKQMLVEGSTPAAIQRKADAAGNASVHAAAALFAATPTTTLPHRDVIQQAFGRHDISGI